MATETTSFCAPSLSEAADTPEPCYQSGGLRPAEPHFSPCLLVIDALIEDARFCQLPSGFTRCRTRSPASTRRHLAAGQAACEVSATRLADRVRLPATFLLDWSRPLWSPLGDDARRTTARSRTSSSSSPCSTATASRAASATGSTRRRLGPDAAHGEGAAAEVRRQAAVSEADRLHRAVPALGRGSPPLYSRHRLRARGVQPRGGARQRQAGGHGRLRADDPAAPARLVARGDLPVVAAAARAAGEPPARARGAPARRPALSRHRVHGSGTATG